MKNRVKVCADKNGESTKRKISLKASSLNLKFIKVAPGLLFKIKLLKYNLRILL